jgi:2-keto-4-pentenoate hydratase
MTALSAADVDRLATLIVAARRDRSQSVPSDISAVPNSNEDGYRVQDAVVAKLGTPVAGWKVGAADASTEPACAPIFAGTIYETGQPIVAEPSTGVEVEIAFQMAKGFAAASSAPSKSDVEAAIGSAHVVLELCASRLSNGMKSAPLLQLADNTTNLGLIIGPRVDNWRDINSKTLVTKLIANGQVIADTTGGHSTGDILSLLVWQIGHCVTRRGGIPAGSVITTGSWMGIRWVPTPADVKGVFEGLGEISARLLPMKA